MHVSTPTYPTGAMAKPSIRKTAYHARRAVGVVVSTLLILAGAIVIPPVHSSYAALNDCAQPVSNSAGPTASDALFVLGSAVGLQVCELCVCDVNGSGTLTASDALSILKIAIGIDLPLACGSCGDPQELDCVREGYLCSLADADPAAIDIVINLLPQVWDVRAAGTMEDAKNFLAAHPDVTDVAGNSVLIRFIVDGMTPVFFHDRTVVIQNSSSAVRVAGPKTQTAVPISPSREVVGEDSTGDGKVDNHDIKRALILAPYEYQFAPNDESAQITTRLENIPAYEGNVVFKHNPAESDRNIILEDFFSFGNYDAVFISTHGARMCEILPDLNNRCEVVIWTRVEWDTQNLPQFSVTGIGVGGYFDPEEEQSQTRIEVALTMDFWRAFYGGALHNQLVSFAACETGNVEGAELARALGGDDFVMMGWTEVTDSDDAFVSLEVFTEELFKGRTAAEARDRIEELGLIPYINSRGIQTTFEHFAPGGDDVRIIELPRLMFQGNTMRDGMNIMASITGTIGDGTADRLELTLQIDGVSEDTKSQFRMHYRVNNQNVAGTYNLSSATLVPGFEYRYEVVHDVALGFPLYPGQLPLEVIVDLPEGGDSRFSVDAALASCSFSAQVSGGRTATFSGPAQFEISEFDGSLTVTVRNAGGGFLDGIQADFTAGPIDPLVPGTYDLSFAQLNFISPIFSAVFFPESDCGSVCGGTLTLDSVEAESISGSVAATMYRILPDRENNEIDLVNIDVEFIAAFGSVTNGGSPYVRCSIEY